MRIKLGLIVLSIPLLAHASVAEDINALLDRFFGGDQAPLEQEVRLPALLEDKAAIVTTGERGLTTDELDFGIKQQIVQQETELEQFEAELDAAQQKLWQTEHHKISSQRQLELLDQQLTLNQRKLARYREQAKEWEDLVETLTYEKSALRAKIRALERDKSEFLSKKFIQKQNFELNPTISWWQWIFSDRSISEIVEDRQQIGRQKNQQAQALAQLQALKNAYEDQEREAVQALAQVSGLREQIAKEQLVLRSLADGKAALVARLESDEDQAAYQEAVAQTARQEAIAYLASLRDQLQTAVLPETNFAQTGAPEFVSPLAGPLVVAAEFKDAAYKAQFKREHLGLDLAAPQGSEVRSVGEGVVHKVATDATGYTYIIVQHAPDLYTVYGHLSKVLVAADDLVAAGQVVAWSGGAPGTAGAGYFSSGPHLHLEVFTGGQFVDPAQFLPNLD